MSTTNWNVTNPRKPIVRHEDGTYGPGQYEYILFNEYIQGGDALKPLTEVQVRNAQELLRRVNSMLALFVGEHPEVLQYRANGLAVVVSSGYRPRDWVETQGENTRSPHYQCAAIDIADAGNILDSWIMKKQKSNPNFLADHGLWLEHPAHTIGWCHLDTNVWQNSQRPHVFIP